mmetsp:Transcript_8161/g.23971  ORF Transcript_8161/g.23971 Transcript_8161/m.23971 type:complete len:372 (-) Transcript_8161:855-1970(-)
MAVLSSSWPSHSAHEDTQRKDHLEHSLDPLAGLLQRLLRGGDVAIVDAQALEAHLAGQQHASGLLLLRAPVGHRVVRHARAAPKVLQERVAVETHGLKRRDGRLRHHGAWVGSEVLDLCSACLARLAHVGQRLADARAHTVILVRGHRRDHARVVLAVRTHGREHAHGCGLDVRDRIVRELEDLVQVLLRGLAHLSNRLHCMHADGERLVLEGLDQAWKSLAVVHLAQGITRHGTDGEGVILQAAHQGTRFALGLFLQHCQRFGSAQSDLPVLVVQRLRELCDVRFAAHPAKGRDRCTFWPPQLRWWPLAAVAHHQRQAGHVLRRVREELRHCVGKVRGPFTNAGQAVRCRRADASVVTLQELLDLPRGSF